VTQPQLPLDLAALRAELVRCERRIHQVLPEYILHGYWLTEIERRQAESDDLRRRIDAAMAGEEMG
jgi:hypothetical protein